MRRLTVEELVVIASSILGIPEESAAAALDRDKALAALAAPFSGVADRETFPWPHQKIAVLAYRLARYHPLPDGNKRLAWVSMREMAARNGYAWTPPGGGVDESVAVMEACAAGTLDEFAFCEWVGDRIDADQAKTSKEIDEFAAVVEEQGGFVAFLTVEERYAQGVAAAISIAEELAGLRLDDDGFLFRTADLLAGLQLEPGEDALEFTAGLEMPGDVYAMLPASIARDDLWVTITFGSRIYRFPEDVLRDAVRRARDDDARAR